MNKFKPKFSFIIMIYLYSFNFINAQGTITKFDLNPGADGIEWPEFGNYRSPTFLLMSTYINNRLALVLSDGENENTKFLVEPDPNLGNIVFDVGLKSEYHFTDYFSIHTEVGIVFALVNRGEESSIYSMKAGGDTPFEMPSEPSATLSLEIGSELWGGAGFTVWFKKRSNLDMWPNDVISFFPYAPDGSDFELWKTDGTNEGTTLVVDINPGSEPSWPSKFTMVLEDPTIPWASQPRPLSAVLFFTADDGTNGIEVWITDGTEAGTSMVKDINTSGSSYPYALTAMNDKLYFVGATQNENSELWVSDGTEAGTMMIKDINPNSGHSNIDQMININNKLYFKANNGTDGTELWMSDGTEEGTKMIKDINPTFSSDPFGFTSYKDKIYFKATDGVSGYELWVTDGTEEGTHIVKDIKPGEESSKPSQLEVFDDMLYFTADDGTFGIELWRTDGTEEGTELASDIYPGPDSSFTNWYELMAVGDNLFFVANDGIIGHELMAYSNKATAVEKNNNLPNPFNLFQNYPNPFNPNTIISYSIPQETFVSLTVYDALGEEVIKLINQEKTAGNYEVKFDGSQLSSGIYFYQLKAGDYLETRKLMLLK